MHCTCISDFAYLFHEEPITVRIKDDGFAWLALSACSPSTMDVKVHTIRRRVHYEVHTRVNFFPDHDYVKVVRIRNIYLGKLYPEGIGVSTGTW